MPRKKASHWLTTAQRERLISEYLLCEEEILDSHQERDNTRARLSELDNAKLIKECVAFMPDCMEDLA